MLWLALTEMTSMEVPAFALLGLAIPVVLLGEWLVHQLGWLQRANIPAAIVGGLLVSVGLLVCAEVRPGLLAINGNTANAFWLWPVLPQWDFVVAKPTGVERPLLILFFTCIGLNASWRTTKQGGRWLVMFWALASLIAVIQSVVGMGLAKAMGQNPLLGLMTGNVTLMGGFGTAAGFAPEIEQAGLTGAATIGVAAATFGVLVAGLLAGVIGGALIEKKVGRAQEDDGGVAAVAAKKGFLAEVQGLSSELPGVARHLAVLLVCMKLGAFVSAWIQSLGITFPVYMGALLVAAVARNLHDAAGGAWLDTGVTNRIGSVALAWLLAVVMVGLQLVQLAHAALPMLVILTVQVALTLAVVYALVFRVMGRDYEAAVMSAGMIGFGLGATSNALATMRSLVQRFGAAPQAFLIVPVVGGFLIDFSNALVTTVALNFFR